MKLTWYQVLKDSGPGQLLAWLAISMILAFVYYPGGGYGYFEACYERGKWEPCEEDVERTWCERESERENLRLLVRAPRYISDFLEEPIELTLVNTGPDAAENVVVTLDLELVGDQGRSLVGYLYTGEDHERQRTNSLVLPEVPGHGQITRAFYLRVPRRYAGVIRASFRLNGEPFGPPFNVDMLFNRRQSLALFGYQALLLPPGSNWLIGAFALVILTILIRIRRKRGERSRNRKYATGEQGPPGPGVPVERPHSSGDVAEGGIPLPG